MMASKESEIFLNSDRDTSEFLEAQYPKSLTDLKLGLTIDGYSQTDPNKIPDWFDGQKYAQAAQIIQRHFFSVFFAHLSGLALGVTIRGLLVPLIYTGKSSTLSQIFHRYLHTLFHVKKWYYGNIFAKDDLAHQSIIAVRRMHSKTGSDMEQIPRDNTDCNTSTVDINRSQPVDSTTDSTTETTKQQIVVLSQSSCPIMGKLSKKEVWLSQYDMAITQFAFIFLIVLYPKKIGISAPERDLELICYYWRCIGYMLGISDKFNIFSGSLSEIRTLCREIESDIFKPALTGCSPDGNRMSREIVTTMSILVSGLTYKGFMQFLADTMNLSTDFKFTTYDWVSYSLQKIVITYLLPLTLVKLLLNWLLIAAIDRGRRIETQLVKYFATIDARNNRKTIRS